MTLSTAWWRPGGTPVQFVYGPLGDKQDLMQGTTALQGRVMLPGGAVAEYTSGATLSYYWHSDWQGSVRLATTSNQMLWMDSAYAPYGEQYALSGANWAGFAGTQQNVVFGTYDAEFRRYDPGQARWLSPDPAGAAVADITNPESWNRYAYVGNNPTGAIDPSGLDDISCFVSEQPCITGAGAAGFLPVFPVFGGGFPRGGGGSGGGMGGGNPQNGGMPGSGGGGGGTPPPPTNDGPPCYGDYPCVFSSGFPFQDLLFGLPFPPILVTVLAQAPQAPAPQGPGKFAQFGNCVAATLKQTIPQDLADLGHNLKFSVKFGVPFGLTLGGAIIAAQPEFAPVAPAVLAVATGQTVSTLASISLTYFEVNFATDLLAAPVYCGENVF